MTSLVQYAQMINGLPYLGIFPLLYGIIKGLLKDNAGDTNVYWFFGPLLPVQ